MAKLDERIDSALSKVSGCCLDDPNDREHVRRVLLNELRPSVQLALWLEDFLCTDPTPRSELERIVRRVVEEYYK